MEGSPWLVSNLRHSPPGCRSPGTASLVSNRKLASRRDLAHEWFDGLAAPHKELITNKDAGHSVVFEEPDAFHRLMTEWSCPPRT